MSHSAASITKSEILSLLWADKKLTAMLHKFNAGAGQDDLKSELFTVLCNQPEEKLRQMHERKELLYFATGIVQRMIFQPNSKFHRTYRSCNQEFSDAIEVPCAEYDRDRDEQEDKIFQVIDKDLHWVESQMMRIYIKEGTIRGASEKTGISKAQVANILKNARTKINTVYNGKLMGNYIVAGIDLVLDVNSQVTPETVMDLMDEVQEYIEFRLNGNKIPTRNGSDAFIKEIKPAKIKKII